MCMVLGRLPRVCQKRDCGRGRWGAGGAHCAEELVHELFELRCGGGAGDVEFAAELVAAVGGPEVDDDIGRIRGEVVDGLLLGGTLELFTLDALGFGREDGRHCGRRWWWWGWSGVVGDAGSLQSGLRLTLQNGEKSSMHVNARQGELVI